MSLWQRIFGRSKPAPEFVPVYPALSSGRVSSPIITAEELRSALHYEPETGVFSWRENRGSVMKAGDEAGTLNPQGYRFIRLGGRTYRAHRLAWLYMTGKWPEEDVDHINRIPGDNSWANLRAATRSQNCANQRTPKHNTSGFKGVTRARCKDRWEAHIIVKGKKIYLGRYDSPEQAHAAYVAGAAKLCGEFANPGNEYSGVAYSRTKTPEEELSLRAQTPDHYKSGRIKPWNKPRASRIIAEGVVGDMRAVGFDGACTIPEMDEWITEHIKRNNLDIGGLTYTPIRAAIKKCSGIRFEIRRLKDDPAYESLRNRHKARKGFVPERAWIFIIGPEMEAVAEEAQLNRRAA